MSQSPQTGQFNSYENKMSAEKRVIESLNPLKRVNSILTDIYNFSLEIKYQGLNPLKRVNSILTMKNGKQWAILKSLNPLKRVNSILTELVYIEPDEYPSKSQSPQTGQFNSYLVILPLFFKQRKDCLNPLKRVNSILTNIHSCMLYFRI